VTIEGEDSVSNYWLEDKRLREYNRAVSCPVLFKKSDFSCKVESPQTGIYTPFPKANYIRLKETKKLPDT